MKSYKIFPSRELEKYIDHYWWVETSDEVITGKPERILADSSIEIIFHFGNPISRINNKGALEQEPKILLIGQTVEPYTILSVDKISMLGVKFRTHTAKYFFDTPVAEMKDKSFDLFDFWGTNANLLYEQLSEASLLNGKIAIIEAYLNSLKPQINKVNLLVENIIKEIDNQNGKICIKQICANNNFSTRYLEKLFLTNVGLSPKLLSRIFQFQNALTLLKTNSQSLTLLGLAAGYFDQSHFIKNFRDFAQCTPSQYINEQFPLQELLQNSN